MYDLQKVVDVNIQSLLLLILIVKQSLFSFAVGSEIQS